MLKLPIFQPHEIESPAQMFRCEFYKATLAAGICIARQGEPNIRGGGQEWMKRPRYEQCASGKCEQGNTIKERLGEYKPAESKRDRQRLERTVAGKAQVAEIEKRLAEDAQPDEIEKTLEETAEDPPPTWEDFQAQRDAKRAAAEIEEPEEKPPPTCRVPGCRTALRVNNLTGMCRMHRNMVTSRQRKNLVPKIARAAGTARNALEPATPAREEPVEEKKQLCSCGRGIRAGHDGVVPEKCFKCRLKAGEVSGRKGKPPRKAKKTPTLVDIAKKHTKEAPAIPAAANDEVVTILEQRRQHHLDQAARIGKAIEALLEVG